MGHREATAGLLPGGQAELLAQRWGIGHRAGRAVYEPGAVAAPAPGGRSGAGAPVRRQGQAGLGQQAAQRRDGQALACLTIRRGREDLAAEPGQIRHGGVAMQNLEKKDIDRDDGRQRTRTPLGAGFATNLRQVLFGKHGRQITLDLSEHALDTDHPWPPVRVMFLTPPSSREANPCASAISALLTRTYRLSKCHSILAPALGVTRESRTSALRSTGRRTITGLQTRSSNPSPRRRARSAVRGRSGSR